MLGISKSTEGFKESGSSTVNNKQPEPHLYSNVNYYSSKASNYIESPFFTNSFSINNPVNADGNVAKSAVVNNNNNNNSNSVLFPNSIGEYGMGRLLGRGAFGSVYEVTSVKHKVPTANDLRYAIKIIEKKSIKNEEMARRVRNEVALHRKLRHPNILALHHFFEDDERVYLVMELCGRGELFNLLRRRREGAESNSSGYSAAGTLNENEARAILRDVVSGLKYLHSNGIIHRDLKLSNILLSETGQAKIADFGLAVKIDKHNERDGSHGNSNSNSNNHNNSHVYVDVTERTICGTPNYLAPEIVHKRKYGKSADIWSIGCLLFSFLTGRPPFDSPNLPETFDRVKRLDYKIPGNVSPAAKDLIIRLLAADPLNRPSFDQIIWHPFFNPSVTLPLSTRRLSPLKQVTKYGGLEILSDGRVVVDFLDTPDILLISPDGMRIEIVDKASKTCTGLLGIGAQLPETIRKRYEYARRFVNLVKGKTAMIVLSTFSFKAYLMENSSVTGSSNGLVLGNVGDFYLNYRDGSVKVDYCWVSRQLRIIDGRSGIVSMIINDPSLISVQDLSSPQHRQILLEFLARYRQCAQIRDSVIHLDGTERSGYQFPIIIREDGDQKATSGPGTLSSHSHSHNHHSTSSSTMFDLNNTNLTSINSSNTLNLNFSKKHIPGIGWCLQPLTSTSTSTSTPTPANTHTNSNETFIVLFNDGEGLHIDGSDDSLIDLTSNRKYPINSDLPEHLKQKLGLFSKFL